MNKYAFTGLLLALFVSIQLQAQLPTPYLVKDFNTDNSGSLPFDFIEYDSLLYFTADDGINGRQFWRTDGSEAGTQIFGNINPSTLITYHKTNSLLFFTFIKNQERQLWRTDGTEMGTFLLDSSIANQNLGSLNNTLFFQKDSALWVSNGNISGTQSLKTIFPTGDPNITDFTELNNKLFFKATDGINGHELWITNGSSTGTYLVKDINSGNGSSSVFELNNIIAFDSLIYFTANDGIHGAELWVSNGTSAGTQLFKDLKIGAEGSNPQELTIFQNHLYFYNTKQLNFEAYLWETDGDSNSVDSFYHFDGYLPLSVISLTATDSSLLFIRDNINGAPTIQLWSTKGDSSNTYVVDGFINSYYNASDHPIYFTKHQDHYFLAISEEQFSSRIYRYQPDSNTIEQTNFEPTFSFPDQHYKLTNFNNSIYYPGYYPYYDSNPSTSIERNTEVSKISPNYVNSRLKDINTTNNASHLFTNIKALDNYIYFCLLHKEDNGLGGGLREVWRSYGNSSESVKPLSTYWLTLGPSILEKVGNRIVFSHYSINNESELFSISNQESSPTLIDNSQMQPYFRSSGVINQQFLYSIDIGNWKMTDGITTTDLLTTYNPSFYPQEPYFFSNKIFFNASKTSPLYAVGTIDSANQIDTTFTTASSVIKRNFISFQSKLFFINHAPNTGNELWISDGTTTGTLVHTDISPGPTSSHLSNFFNFQNRLYFKKDNQIWRLDHPAHQPYPFVDLDTLVECNNARNFKLFNDHLYFIATNDNGDDILWMMNGSRMSLRPLLTPDGNPIRTNAISIIEDYILFSNWDPTYGRELWISGGYTHNTYRLSDINPGTASSSPAQFTKAGNLIYFVAEDGVHGRELWAIDALPLSQETLPTLVEQDLNIYPNPSKGQFTLELNQGPENPITAHLYNLQGQLLQSYQLSDKINTLESKALPAGLYLLQLEDGRALKIVIE